MNKLSPNDGVVRKLSRNIFASLMRVTVNALVALVLPAYLTSRLPITVYGAWVLILQLGAYVSFLDLGIQTGVAKFVAEYEARGDNEGAARHASAGLALTLLTGFIGVLLTVILAFQVPYLFNSMPESLYADVRFSVLMVGISLSVSLCCSIFSAVFIGLQRYAVPMALMIANRLAYSVVVVVAIYLHGGLRTMATAVAVVNISVALAQIVCWKQMAGKIRIAWSLIERIIVIRMIRYCSFLAVWSVGMLLVSGLDVTIVGHYDYPQTAFYSIAILPTNFILLIISSVLGPMLPASSALSTNRTPTQMGNVLIRVTRYSILLLLMSGLPLVVYGHGILHLWVGELYANSSLVYLRILIVANIIRNACLPYSTMVVATGRQKSATVASVSEAVVNLGSSVYLAGRFGAIGVAYGTLIGSLVSVLLHFLLSMPATNDTLQISRKKLIAQGFGRPLTVCLPSLFFLAPGSTGTNTLTWLFGTMWAFLTLGLAWKIGLNRQERTDMLQTIRCKFRLHPTT